MGRAQLSTQFWALAELAVSRPVSGRGAEPGPFAGRPAPIEVVPSAVGPNRCVGGIYLGAQFAHSSAIRVAGELVGGCYRGAFAWCVCRHWPGVVGARVNAMVSAGTFRTASPALARRAAPRKSKCGSSRGSAPSAEKTFVTNSWWRLFCSAGFHDFSCKLSQLCTPRLRRSGAKVSGPRDNVE